MDPGNRKAVLAEGVQKLLHPHALSDPSWAVGILVTAIGLEGLSFRTAVIEARRAKGRAGWWEFVRKTKNPELPVVLLEDLGALLGLVMALLAIGLAAWTGDSRFDAAGSIAIGALLGVIAIVLASEMKSLLIGESASRSHREQIIGAITGSERVQRLIHMRTQHLGPDELLVAAKVELEPHLTAPELANAIDAVERRIRDAVGVACVIYIEPDIFRPDPECDVPT